jgi:hypothetical protein
MNYTYSEVASIYLAVDKFLQGQPHVMPDSEFDKMYDHSVLAIRQIAPFSDDLRQSENDFVSSRYVDQIPCMGVSGPERVKLADILQICQLAQKAPPFPFVLLIDLYPHLVAAFPDRILCSILLDRV